MEAGMMMAQINAAAFWVMTAMFLWFFYGPWQAFWADWYRQEIFSARDRLFDLAARGVVSFNDEAYREDQSGMNNRLSSSLSKHSDPLGKQRGSEILSALCCQFPKLVCSK